MKYSFSLLLIIFLSISCNEDNPVKTENHRPEIISLTADLQYAEPGDSVLVTCIATDPDGDTLVYDWYTDSRLKIKGAMRNENWLFHTYENSRVVYPQNIASPADTAWLECTARDIRGGSDSRIINIIVRKDSSKL